MIKRGYKLILKEDLAIGSRTLEAGTELDVLDNNGLFISVEAPGIGAGGFSEAEAFQMFTVKDDMGNIVVAPVKAMPDVDLESKLPEETKQSIMTRIMKLFK